MQTAVETAACTDPSCDWQLGEAAAAWLDQLGREDSRLASTKPSKQDDTKPSKKSDVVWWLHNSFTGVDQDTAKQYNSTQWSSAGYQSQFHYANDVAASAWARLESLLLSPR